MLKEVSGRTWGAETNILRETHKVFIESVISYGLVTTGSGAYETETRKLDTCALNPPAKAITGASFSARQAVLHATAGTLAAHNLYIQNCARAMDRGLRALNSTIARSLWTWNNKSYKVTGWRPRECALRPESKLLERVQL